MGANEKQKLEHYERMLRLFEERMPLLHDRYTQSLSDWDRDVLNYYRSRAEMMRDMIERLKKE